MLDALKKALSKISDEPATELKVDTEAVTTDLTVELTTKLDEATVQLTQFEGKVTELATKLTSTEAALAEALSVIDKMNLESANKAAAELNQKNQARKQLIVEAIGEARADATFEAVKNLDDASFSTVLSAVKLSLDVEAAKPEFNEVGVSASAEPAETSKEMAMLLAKYQTKTN